MFSPKEGGQSEDPKSNVIQTAIRRGLNLDNFSIKGSGLIPKSTTPYSAMGRKRVRRQIGQFRGTTSHSSIRKRAIGKPDGEILAFSRP